MANELCFYPSNNDGYDFATKVAGTYVYFDIQIGYNKTLSSSSNGALRFENVTINQGTTVSSAFIKFRINNAIPNDNANVKIKIWGIDEDDTNDFSSDPFGRSKTSASNTVDLGSPTDMSWSDMDVTNLVNEILGRGGWHSGHAMGFFLEDNGTATDQTRMVTEFYSGSGSDSFLVIRQTEPDFTPTPKTVAAPTFPAADDCGIRVSAPNKDVLTVTDTDIWFTTKKRTFGVYQEGEVTLSGGTYSITHNLGYQPAVLAYANYSGKKYRFPDFWNLNSGGIIYTNKTKATISSTADKVYYYIFIDPIELV